MNIINNLMKKGNRTRLLLGLIVILGIFLRLYHISDQGIWFDEAFSIYESQRHATRILASYDPSPPLYYLVLHFWMEVFGTSEVSVRVPSAIFGVISIIVIYLLGKLIFNKRVGIYSALLIALSPIHIFYSQEARAYSLLFLLTMLSAYFYLRLKQDFSRNNIAGYLISCIFMLYSHLYAALILLVLNMHFFLTEINFSSIRKIKLSKKAIHWIYLQIIILITYVPWLITISRTLSLGSTEWISKPTFLDLITTFYTFISGFGFSFFGDVLWLGAIVLFFRYTFKSDKNKTLFLLSWVLIPILLPFAFSLVFKPIFVIRYTLLASLPLYIIISRSITNMDKIKRRALTISIIILYAFTLYIQQSIEVKDRWEDVSDFMKSNVQDGEKIFIVAQYEALPFSYYYRPGCYKETNIDDCYYAEGIYPLKSINQLQGLEDDSLWLVLSREYFAPESREILPHLYDNYEVKKTKRFALNEDVRVFSQLRLFVQKKSFRFNEVEVKYLIKKT